MNLHRAGLLTLMALIAGFVAVGQARGSAALLLAPPAQSEDNAFQAGTWAMTIPAQVLIKPHTINTKNVRPHIRAYIELPGTYLPADIQLHTVLLTLPGVGSIPAMLSGAKVGDHNDNGVPDLRVKFDRVSVNALLQGQSGSVALTVSGSLTGGLEFEGEDTANVIAKPLQKVVAVVQPSNRDAYVDEDQAGVNYGSQPVLRVQHGAKEMREFLGFDLASIPAGAKVSSVLLEVYAPDPPDKRQQLRAYRVTSSWTESTVTWNNQPPVTASGKKSARTPNGPGWMTWTVTRHVKGMLDGEYGNHGWSIRDDKKDNWDPTILRSKESATSALWPRLVVTYKGPNSEVAELDDMDEDDWEDAEENDEDEEEEDDD